MTTPEEDRTDTRARVRNGSSTGGGYEWTCPYCGQSRINASDGEDGEDNAITALRTHIVASGGAEHGPRNGFPADFDDLDLPNHVVEVDGRR